MLFSAVVGTIAAVISIFWPPPWPPPEPPPDVCLLNDCCYIICESAFDEKEAARRRVIELGHSGYNGKSGYLWIPDYDCLSDARLYQVFIGPFHDLPYAQNELCKYNERFNTITYGVRICNNTIRFEFRCR